MTQSKVIWAKGAFSLQRRSLEIDENQNPTKAQLQGAARDILAFRDSGSWGIGDLVVFAEKMGRPEPVNEIAEEVVRDRQMVRKCYYVSKAYAPEEREFDLWWTFYHAVYTFPADVRARLLSLAVEHSWTLDEFKKHLKSLRSNVERQMQSFPTGTYALILARPPWRNAGDDMRPDMDGMDVEDIKSLTDPAGRTVTEIAAPDALLYLAAIPARIGDAMDILRAWGFEYVSSLVWVKDTQGDGEYARARHELILIGSRGDVVPPDADLRPDSVVQEPRANVLPGYVYDMLDTLYGRHSKIELFTQQARDGWDRWGEPKADTNALAADAGTEPDETGDVQEAGAEQTSRESAKGSKRKNEPKSRVADSATGKKAAAPKPRLVKTNRKAAGASEEAGAVH